MAAIPAAQTIQTPAPRPSMGVPEESYRAGVLGDTLADTADSIGRDAGALLDQQDQMQYATARSAFLQQKATIENSFAADNDWHTIPQRYNEQMTEAAGTAQSSIENTKYQAHFKTQSADEIANGSSAMIRLARAKQVDAARGSLSNTLETNRLAALSSPENAPGLIQSTLGAISGARANGFIDDEDAVKIRQGWTQGFGKGWLTIQPDAKQAELLNDPTTKTGTPADFVDPAERAILGREARQRMRVDNAVATQVYAQTASDQIAFLRSGGDPSKVTVTPDSARSMLGNTPQGDAVAGEITRAYKYNTLVRQMRLAPQSEINEILTRNAPTGGAGATSINDAIIGQESGGNPKVGTSVDGAVGPGQMTPGTFKQFAQPSEDINNPGDNLAVSNRAIEHYKQEYGGDAGRVAVAYFSGEGNVAPAGSATPWKVNAKDGNGKSVSSYVEDVAARIGGAVGFREQQQDYNDLRQIALDRQKTLTEDPATYAVSSDPATGAAYLEAQKSPQAFDAYVHRLNGTYTALEQPSDARAILPKGDAVATIKSLNTVPPADAVKQIDSLKAVSGRWWPQVYTELAQNGLPPAFQAVTIASPQDATVMVAAMQTGKGHASVGVGVTEDDKKLGGTIDQELDGDAGLKNLRSSLTTYGRAGVDLYGGTRQAVRQTAMYLMDQNPSLSASDATTRAANMVTGTFDFMAQGDHPAARVPKGALDAAQTATTAALAVLKSGDVRPYPASGVSADQGGESEQERHGAALYGAKNAWWLTVQAPDGGTILRAIDSASGLPVVLVNGQKLDVRVSSGTGAIAPPAHVAPATQPIGVSDVLAASGRKMPGAPALKIPRRVR